MDYKEYLNACETKKKWEDDRKTLQAVRHIRKQRYPFDNLPEEWVDQLKYLIEALSYDIYIQNDIVKRSMYHEKAKSNPWMMKNLTARVDKIKEERRLRRRELYIELKGIE